MSVANDWVSIDGILTGSSRKVYGMLSGDDFPKVGSRGTNSMRQMRAAFGMSTDNEGIHEWLKYWDSLTPEHRMELRRMNLKKLFDSDIPSPPGVKL